MRWLDGHHRLKGHGFEQTLGDRAGKPGMLQFLGSQRVGHDRTTRKSQHKRGRGEWEGLKEVTGEKWSWRGEQGKPDSCRMD